MVPGRWQLGLRCTNGLSGWTHPILGTDQIQYKLDSDYDDDDEDDDDD